MILGFSMCCTFAVAEVTVLSMLECGKETNLRVNDEIRCDKCGYRILYKKKRADKSEPIQYEAI